MSFAFTVRRSRIHGKGLFAAEPLPARRKIGELTGRRLDIRAARRLAHRSACIAIVEFDDGTALDATCGNHFRFVNHSCSPNTYMRLAYGRVEFYTLRGIAKGEELTCDYGESHHEGKLRCRCGSERCSGAL